MLRREMTLGLFWVLFFWRRSAFDVADFHCGVRDLVVGGQLLARHLFDGIALADNEVAGTAVFLWNAGAILGDTVVNLDVHGCSPCLGNGFVRFSIVNIAALQYLVFW